MSVVWVIESSKQQKASIFDTLAKNFAVRIIDRSAYHSVLENASVPHVIIVRTELKDNQELRSFIERAQDQFQKTFFVFMGNANAEAHSSDSLSPEKRNYFFPESKMEDLLAILEKLFLYGREDGKLIHYQGVRLNMETLECWLAQNQDPIALSFKEAKLLRFFIQSAGTSLSRTDILTKVWENVRVSPRTIDCHISRLRKKLANAPVNIESIYGGGYVFS